MALRQALTQMIAMLEGERAALATLDLERILVCAQGKESLTELLERHRRETLDDECLGLLDAARQLNAINRKMRNLIAANIQARLSMLTGSVNLYGGSAMSSPPRIAQAVWHEA